VPDLYTTILQVLSGRKQIDRVRPNAARNPSNPHNSYRKEFALMSDGKFDALLTYRINNGSYEYQVFEDELEELNK